MKEPTTELSSHVDEGRPLQSVHERPRFGEYLALLRERWDFIWFSAVQQLRSENVRTSFGSLWFLLTPLLNILVYWLVFGKLLNVNRGGGGNYVTFLTIGILVFDLMARPLPGAAGLLDKNITLIRSVYFPRAVLPTAYSIEQLIRFLPSIVVMIIFVLVGGESVRWSWLLLLPTLVLGYIFMLGLTLILTRIGKVAADIGLALPHLIRVLLYGSGVFYLPSLLTSDERVLRLFDLNPFFEILSLARGALLEDQPASGGIWIGAIVWAFGTLTAGMVVFWHAETSYGE